MPPSKGVAGERYLLNGFTLHDRRSARARRRAWPASTAAADGARARRVAGAWIVEQGALLAGRKPPVCREMVRTLLHGHRYDGSRAERELGVQYTKPEDTLRRTVEWARETGLLKNA